MTSQKRKSKHVSRPTVGSLVTKEMLEAGMIVELEWTDVQGMERLTMEELQSIPDPGPTLTWGVVVKVNPKSLVLAHEIGDDGSDGCHASIYPFKLIESAKLVGRIDLRTRLKV